jgi:hypothetical protein
MAVETRDIRTETAPGDLPTDRGNAFERAIGIAVFLAGGAAVVWALPTTFRYPLALAVALSVTAVGAGVAWHRPWAWSGLLCLGLILCSASIGYLLVEGSRIFSFAWFFVPGAYFIWAGLRGIVASRRVAAPAA